MIHNDTYIWDIYHHFFNRKIHSFKGSIYPIFLSSYVFSWQNGALEPFEDEKSSSSWPAMVGRWVERLYTSHVVRRISTNYTWHQPKQDTIFVLRKSLKTTIPVASSLIPPQPQSDLKWVPLCPTFFIIPVLSTHLPTQTQGTTSSPFQIWSLGFPPQMAPYPQATGHCPTSRFHVDVSWHKSQALVTQLLAKTVALFWGFHWLDLYPPPECQWAPVF